MLYAEAERASNGAHVQSSLMLPPADADTICLSSELSGLGMHTQGPSQCIAFPFCSSRDMLRALCIMRC
jgi:hypothetical protein